MPCSVFLNGMVPIMTSAGTSRAWPGPDGVATNCNIKVKVCYIFPYTDQLKILIYEKKFRLQILISFFIFIDQLHQPIMVLLVIEGKLVVLVSGIHCTF